MKDYYEFTFGERLEAFRSMGRDNAPLLDYVDRTSVRRIPHIDEKCVIFSVDDDDTRTLKYVVDPETKRKLSFRLQAIVLRGLKNQASVQDVLGVQVLHSPSFHEGIEGLVGPFDYLEGFEVDIQENKGEKTILIRYNTDKGIVMKKLSSEQLETIIQR